MFVEITVGPATSVYECDRVHIHPVQPTPEQGEAFEIVMEREGGRTASYRIDKWLRDPISVVLKNDRGVTFEHVFSKLEGELGRADRAA